MQDNKIIKKAISVYYVLLMLIPLISLYEHFDILDFSYLLVVLVLFVKIIFTKG